MAINHQIDPAPELLPQAPESMPQAPTNSNKRTFHVSQFGTGNSTVVRREDCPGNVFPCTTRDISFLRTGNGSSQTSQTDPDIEYRYTNTKQHPSKKHTSS